MSLKHNRGPCRDMPIKNNQLSSEEVFGTKESGLISMTTQIACAIETVFEIRADCTMFSASRGGIKKPNPLSGSYQLTHS
jgi:hypothetical protein